MNKFFGFGLIALIASVSAHAIFIDMIEISDDVSINNNISCTTCNFVGNFVKHEIDQGNQTISNITHFIEEICDEIKGPSAQECLLVVKTIREMVNLFSQGFNVTQICHKLGFCP